MQYFPYMKSLLIVALFITSFAIAKEGFFNTMDQVPGYAQLAWKATYGVFPKSFGGSGSAVLFKKVPHPSGGALNSLYFLTSSHVILGTCGLSTGPCTGIKLSSKIIQNKVTDQYSDYDPLGFTFENVEVVKITKVPDLAILKVTVDGSIFYQSSLTAIDLERKCDIRLDDRVTIIGYPGTIRRAGGVLGTTSENKFFTMKRVSTGFITSLNEIFASKYGGEYNYLFTSADILPGNSGGPIVNYQGKFISLAQAIPEYINGRPNYLGSDTTSPKKGHSLGEKCESIRAYLPPGL